MTAVQRFVVAGSLIAAMLGSLASLPARAQGTTAFPSKPVRLISGPGPDVAARVLATALGEAWGQQVVTETLPAASGKIAAETVQKSAPDGHVLLNATSSFQIARALAVQPVDVARDLVPIALTNVLPFVLVTPAGGAESVKALVDRAKAAPGKLNYASGGNGTLPHLAAELFKQVTRTDIVHVPYKAADQAALAVVAGQVDLMFTSYPVVGGQVRAGKLRMLASTAGRRLDVLPDVATLAESGFADYELVSWTGLFAPAGTPPAIVARIRTDLARVLATDAMKERYATLGFAPRPGDLSDERLVAFLERDAARWAKLVKDSGARVD